MGITAKQVLESQGLSEMYHIGCDAYKPNDNPMESMTPLNCGVLPDANIPIYIDDNLIGGLGKLKASIDMQRRHTTCIEMPYFATGKIITENNGEKNILINSLYFDENLSANNSYHANFSNALTNHLNTFLQDATKDSVLITGHTHPHNPNPNFSSKITACFSEGDLNGYIKLENDVKNFNKNVMVLNQIINEIGDFNTIAYNSKQKKFLKFDEIYLIDKEFNTTPLPAFTIDKYLADDKLRYDYYLQKKQFNPENVFGQNL